MKISYGKNVYGKDELNAVVKKLYSTEYFKDVSISLENGILYISVKENPIIQYIKFDGVKNKRILEIFNEQIELKKQEDVMDDDNKETKDGGSGNVVVEESKEGDDNGGVENNEKESIEVSVPTTS